MLANKLRYLNLQVHDLSCGTVGDYIDQTALVQPEDLVIAISFPRYTKRVVTALEDMHRRGVPIALITDKGLRRSTRLPTSSSTARRIPARSCRATRAALR